MGKQFASCNLIPGKINDFFFTKVLKRLRLGKQFLIIIIHRQIHLLSF